MNLFEINANIEYLLAQLFDAETPEEEKACLDALESLDIDLEQQLENVTKSIRNAEAEKKAYIEQMDFFKAKADKAARKIDRSKGLVKYVMEQRGMEKFKAGNFDLRIQANGGKKSIEYYVSPSDLPESLSHCEVVYKPNDEKIRWLLDAGITEIEEDGNHYKLNELFAYKPKGTHLRIS